MLSRVQLYVFFFFLKIYKGNSPSFVKQETVMWKKYLEPFSREVTQSLFRELANMKKLQKARNSGWMNRHSHQISPSLCSSHYPDQFRGVVSIEGIPWETG